MLALRSVVSSTCGPPSRWLARASGPGLFRQRTGFNAATLSSSSPSFVSSTPARGSALGLDPLSREFDSLFEVEVDPEVLNSFKSVVKRSFAVSEDRATRWLQQLGTKKLRFIYDQGDKSVICGLGFSPYGINVGRKRCQIVCITAVAGAPEFRGEGTAGTLMKDAMRELHSLDVPLSMLEPITDPLYRMTGFEKAGTRNVFRIRTNGLPSCPRNIREKYKIKEITTEEDRMQAREVHASFAKKMQGCILRNDYIWYRSEKSIDTGEPYQGYLFINRETDRPEGYTYFSSSPEGNLSHNIDIHDIYYLTNNCLLRLCDFFRRHFPIVPEVRMFAVSEEPILKHIQEPVQWDIRATNHWMLRIVNVKHAIECRGYHRSINASMCFDITDDLVEENNGLWFVSVSQGQGHAEKLDSPPEGCSRVRISIGNLAVLYAGHNSPTNLERLDQLKVDLAEGSELEDVLDEMSVMFFSSGPFTLLDLV